MQGNTGGLYWFRLWMPYVQCGDRSLYYLAPESACSRGVQAHCERGLSPRSWLLRSRQSDAHYSGEECYLWLHVLPWTTLLSRVRSSLRGTLPPLLWPQGVAGFLHVLVCKLSLVEGGVVVPILWRLVVGYFKRKQKNLQAHGYRCSFHPGVFQSIDFPQGTWVY